MRRFAVLAVAGVLAVVVPVLAAARGGGTPTYYGDVGPILNEHCAGCHVQGGVAPFALTSARDAQRYARAIAAVVKTGTMPPWPPGPDSQALVGESARLLTQADKDILAAWAGAGAPVGERRLLPKPRVQPAPRGSRVLSLAPAKAYRPTAAGRGLDDYHCFLLDPRLKRNTFITGAVIEPSAAPIVHHVILFEAAGAQATAAVRLNRASGGKGWTCFGGPGLPPNSATATTSSLRFGAPQWLAAWVPGHVNNKLPAGLGVLVHKGAKIVMQVHYNLTHGSRPDRSRAVLTTAPASARLKPLDTMLLAAPVELRCPSGAAGPACARATALNDLAVKYGPDAALMPAGLLFLCGKKLTDYPRDVGDGSSIATTCDRAVTERLTIHGVAGHMHLRGRDISIVLDPGTPRERTLLHIPAWDFRWQDVYFLRKPVAVGPGGTLRLSCRFDNSAAAQAPRYVVWGEGTNDEMCLGLLSVTRG